MKTRLTTLAVAAILTAGTSVHSAIILQDDFSYADGSLTNLSAPKWTQHSGTANDFNIASGKAVIGGSAPLSRSADVNSLFLNQPYSVTATNAAIYAKFDVEFTVLPSTSGEYFVHFMPSSFRGRIIASTTGAAAGKFKIGISHSTSTKTNLPGDFDLNTVYTLVVRILPSSGVCTLWHNPVNETEAGVTPTDAAVSSPGISGFAMRQANNEGNLFLDNLVVGTAFSDVVPASAGSNPPFITVHPVGGSISAGVSFSFTNTAGGDEPLSYEWRKDDVTIPNENARIYTIASAVVGDTGGYTVVVTNTSGSVTSSIASLTVSAAATAPAITNQPVSQTVSYGSSATFTVGASGTDPLSYQWQFHGTNLSGATAADYTVSNAFTNNAGPYQVIVTNVAGAITSDVVTLTVTAPVVTSIASLHATVDTVNYRPTNTTALFSVEGIVTSHQNLTPATNALFYLQDSSAGVACFWAGNASASLPPAGTLVRVTAPLASFNGVLELAPVVGNVMHSVTTLSTGNPLPALTPLPFDATTQNDPAIMDALEGSYVVASNVFLELTPPTFTGTCLLTNQSGETFTFFANASTDVSGQTKPLGPLTVIGVLGQFDTSDPRTSSYQIIPTRYADIISLSKAATVRFTNVLSNLVRPGQPTPNTLSDGVLRTDEKLTMSVHVSDPDGAEVTITPLTSTLPASASWTTGATTGTNLTATFNFQPTAADAGSNYTIAIRSVNTFVTSTNIWNIYVPTLDEQQVFITEFLANPSSNTNSPHFNPLHRADVPTNNITVYDEYLEIANQSPTDLDLYDWSIADAVGVRHRFYNGGPSETLAASNAIVVYGGPLNGNPPVLPGLAFPASESTAGLALNNTGTETITLRRSTNVIDRVTYAGASLSSIGSMSRFPTLTDNFVPQAYVGSNTTAGLQYDGGGWNGTATAPVGVSNIAVNPGSPLSLTFTATAGEAYTLWQADEITAPFVIVNGGIATNTAGTFFVTNPPAVKQFYFITQE